MDIKLEKVAECIKFLKFSHKKGKYNNIILFKLFENDVNDTKQIIRIIINDDKIEIDEVDDCDNEININIDLFIKLYSESLRVWDFVKIFGLKNEKLTINNLSLNKFRKFITQFDFAIL